MGDLRLRIAGVFAPRERELFVLLDALGSNGFEAADRLEELAHFFPDRSDIVDAIAENANESARLAAQLRVTATFVTPIEREDLEAFATHLDDLVRSTHAVAALLGVYGIDGVRSHARRLTQLLAGCSKEISAAGGLFRTAGDVAPHTDLVRSLVQEGEEQSRAGLAELFAEDPAAIELVRWKDLFDRLQGAIDAARRAAGTLDVISSKQR